MADSQFVIIEKILVKDIKIKKMLQALRIHQNVTCKIIAEHLGHLSDHFRKRKTYFLTIQSRSNNRLTIVTPRISSKYISATKMFRK